MKRLAKNGREYKYDNEMIVTSHPGSYFPLGQFKIEGKKQDWNSYDAVAMYYTKRLKEKSYRKGYLELLNEPFVHDRDMHTNADSIINMYKHTAEAIHKNYPNVRVGGHGHAWPAYELNDFQIWNERMGKFIEVAGKEMDFLSVHLYSTFYDDKASFRAGANVEAILDLIEAKSINTFGNVKPLVISEYGTGFKKGSKLREEYFENRDWYILHGVNSKLFQFIKRSDNIEKTVPFICGTAEWYKFPYPYPFVLFHKTKEGYQLTHLMKFYEFWKGIEGEYIYSNSNNVDIQTITLRNDDIIFICLDNLEKRDYNLNLINSLPSNAIKSFSIRRLYSKDQKPLIIEEKLKDLSKVILHEDETAIITLKLNDGYPINSIVTQKSLYHPDIIQKVKQNQKEYTFELNENKENLAYASLKLGVSRPTSADLYPKVFLNGKEILLTKNEMGRPQNFKEVAFEGADEPKTPTFKIIHKPAISL